MSAHDKIRGWKYASPLKILVNFGTEMFDSGTLPSLPSFVQVVIKAGVNVNDRPGMTPLGLLMDQVSLQSLFVCFLD